MTELFLIEVRFLVPSVEKVILVMESAYKCKIFNELLKSYAFRPMLRAQSAGL